jgi:hypothetical protein
MFYSGMPPSMRHHFLYRLRSHLFHAKTISGATSLSLLAQLHGALFYDLDLAVCCADSPDSKAQSCKNGTFKDVTSEVGLDKVFMPMGANFGDIDNDGFLDIYLGTGNLSYESLLVPSVLLRNHEGKYFVDVTTHPERANCTKVTGLPLPTCRTMSTKIYFRGGWRDSGIYINCHSYAGSGIGTNTALSPPVRFLLFFVSLARAMESCCRSLGSRRFTERLHSNAFVTHFQHRQVFCAARRLENYVVARCRLHQRAPQR